MSKFLSLKKVGCLCFVQYKTFSQKSVRHPASLMHRATLTYMFKANPGEALILGKMVAHSHLNFINIIEIFVLFL